jgi:hypothetical protein
VFVECSWIAGLADPPSMAGPPTPPGRLVVPTAERWEPNLGKVTDGSLND